jgi:hypothetical protein
MESLIENPIPLKIIAGNPDTSEAELGSVYKTPLLSNSGHSRKIIGYDGREPWLQALHWIFPVILRVQVHGNLFPLVYMHIRIST